MQVKSKKLVLGTPVVILVLLVALILAACGDATNTVSSPVATAVSTTKAATTAAAGATTAAATTAAAGAATAAAGASSAAVVIPNITGATEVKLDTAFSAELAKQIPGLTNPSIKLYVSDDEAQTLADNADVAFTGAGYKFGLPGMTKPTAQGDNIAGFYVKTGSADLLLAAGIVPADAGDFNKALNIPGMTSDEAKKLAEQVKGKKSMLIIIAAPDLLQSMMAAAGSGMGAATSTTAAAK